MGVDQLGLDEMGRHLYLMTEVEDLTAYVLGKGSPYCDSLVSRPHLCMSCVLAKKQGLEKLGPVDIGRSIIVGVNYSISYK